MKIYQIPNHSDLKPKGLVCVVDVIRAFTTAAYALDKGAEKIILVKDAENALELQKKNPNFLLIGEEGGYKIEGFDFGNSPAEILAADLEGKTLVQRTTNGTKGVVQHIGASKLIVGGFPNAQATIDYIKASGEEEITFVITNNFRSNEDAMFANYASDKLFAHDIDANLYLDVVKNSRYAKRFYKKENQHLDPKDIEYVCALDVFNFVMEVKLENGIPVLYKKEV